MADRKKEQLFICFIYKNVNFDPYFIIVTSIIDILQL
jgi:hypothetical protein